MEVGLAVLLQFLLLRGGSQLLHAHRNWRNLLVLALLGIVILSFHGLLDDPVLIISALAFDLLGGVVDVHSVYLGGRRVPDWIPLHLRLCGSLCLDRLVVGGLLFGPDLTIHILC